MGWFSDSYADGGDSFDNTHHASMTHELLAGGVAFEAAKAYEDHCAANGKPTSHALAKELLAGFAGAAADRLVETKGLDAWDRHKDRAAQQATVQLSETVYEQDYQNVQTYQNDY